MTDTERITIKRQFAVVLEDAIEVPLPADLAQKRGKPTFRADVETWARENYDRLFEAARDLAEADETRLDMGEEPRQVTAEDHKVLWEDEHVSTLDSFDDVFIVER